MNKSKYLIIISATMLLASCGLRTQDSSESSKPLNPDSSSQAGASDSANPSGTSGTSIESSSEEELPGLSFSEFASLITNAAYVETNKSSGGTYKEVNQTGSVTDSMEYKLDVYDDLTSYAEGSVIETNVDQEVVTKDTFIDRRAIEATKIKEANDTYDYTLFYSIRDYKDDAFSKYTYQDSITTLYVLDNASEDVDETLYVNKTEAKWGLTLKATNSILTFFDTYFYSNAYASQMGVTRVNETVFEDHVEYSLNLEYTLDGDLNDKITYHSQLEVKMDAKKTKVLSYKSLTSSSDVSNMNPDDIYYSSTEVDVTVEYGTRASAYSEDVPSVYDYLLHSVDEFGIVDFEGNEFEDVMEISPANTYLWIYPKTYSPTTAIGVSKNTITPVLSSNEDVVKISGATSSNPCFEIVGGGMTTLTYSYYGMDENNVYTEYVGTIDIRIADTPNPTDIKFISTKSDGEVIWDKELQVGKEYVIETRVMSGSTSMNVNQEYTVESSDPDGLAVSINDKNDIAVTPKKAGAYEITVTSTENPTVSATYTCTVVDNTTVDLAAVLCGSTWECIYTHFQTKQFKNTLVFNSDGTGSLTQYIYSDDETYPADTFKWKLDGPNLVISDWSYYPKNTDIGYFVKGVISGDMTKIDVVGEHDGTYTYEIVKE